MTEQTTRRWFRIRLWHLFVLVGLAAVLVWLWPQVGLDVDHYPGDGSRAELIWRGTTFVLWDTFPPPPPPMSGFGIGGFPDFRRLPRSTNSATGAVLDTNNAMQMMGVDIEEVVDP